MSQKSHKESGHIKSGDVSFPAKIKDIFPDDTLAETVANELNKTVNDEVDQNDLLAVTTLVLFSSNITGIQYLKNLEALECSLRHLSDISLLSGLEKLQSLDLSGNDIVDISPLKTLTNLTTLDLVSNKINDITPLSHLVNLTELHLDNTEIHAGDTTVKGHNSISDLTPLKGLSNLEILSISDNKIVDVTALGNLKKLMSLHLEGNQVNDISALNNLASLTVKLDLSRNSIGDFSTIPALKNIKSFSGEKQLIELPKTAERQHHLILKNRDGSDVTVEPGSTGHYNHETVYWNNQGENQLVYSGEHISGVVKELTV